MLAHDQQRAIAANPELAYNRRARAASKVTRSVGRWLHGFRAASPSRPLTGHINPTLPPAHHPPHTRGAHAAVVTLLTTHPAHYHKVDLAKTYSKPKKKSCGGCSGALPDSFNG